MIKTPFQAASLQGSLAFSGTKEISISSLFPPFCKVLPSPPTCFRDSPTPAMLVGSRPPFFCLFNEKFST